jgi:L-lactate permease
VSFVLVSLLLKALPGPAWLRALIVLLLIAAVGVFLWETGFGWLMRHYGAPLQGDPVSGG